MHELSIAIQIVDTVEEKAKISNATKVKEITLEIGQLSGIEIDALKFALDSAINQTILEHAIISIIEIEGKAQCNHCHTVFNTDDLYCLCPHCQQFNSQILRGQEMLFKSMVIT